MLAAAVRSRDLAGGTQRLVELWRDRAEWNEVFRARFSLIHSLAGVSDSSRLVELLRTANEDRRFVFQITNTGVGIEPEQRDRIFHAFEQGERATRRKFGGLGLGLTISKRLLELQGGAISVHSEGLNRGASFKLSLATVDSPKVTTVSHSTTDHSPARSLQLLVVDDHPQTLRVLASLLRKQGHKVLTAECVQAAIKLLEDAAYPGDIRLPQVFDRNCRLNAPVPVIENQNAVPFHVLPGRGDGLSPKTLLESNRFGGHGHRMEGDQ